MQVRLSMMIRHSTAFCLATILSLSVATLASGSEELPEAETGRAPAASEEQIERWIDQLDADRFADREQATRQLSALGEAILPRLERVAKEGRSAQIRSAAQRIVRSYYQGRRRKALKADQAKWTFDDKQTSLEYYIKQYRGRYAVKPPKDNPLFGDNPAAIWHDNKKLHEFKCHAETAFVFVDRNTIVYSQHHPISSGCSIVAFDLAKGKTLWHTGLAGLGPISHSKYRNRVNLRFNEEGFVTILGHESAGRYIEQLDVKTGKQLGHKLFDR